VAITTVSCLSLPYSIAQSRILKEEILKLDAEIIAKEADIIKMH